jgi:hypothetical protein
MYTLLLKQLRSSTDYSDICIWGRKDSPGVLSTKYSALRFLLGVGKVCPIESLFGETGWTPFDVLIKFNTLTA